MSGTNDLARMVPGFEFLQNLIKGAGAGIPGMSQWVAPTLDPEELDKRIQELKTVQFWLEQNARLLGTTIQALEVQRMTLSTLQTMNLPLTDLREALKIRVPTVAPAPAAAAADDEEDEDEPEAEPAPPPSRAAPRKAASAPAVAATPAIDPMQWWGALTQQFTEIATKAVKDSAADAARNLAGAAVKQAAAGAVKTLKKVAPKPARATRKRSP